MVAIVADLKVLKLRMCGVGCGQSLDQGFSEDASNLWPPELPTFQPWRRCVPSYSAGARGGRCADADSKVGQAPGTESLPFSKTEDAQT